MTGHKHIVQGRVFTLTVGLHPLQRPGALPLRPTAPTALLLDPRHGQPLRTLKLIVLAEPMPQHAHHLLLAMWSARELLLKVVAQTAPRERAH